MDSYVRELEHVDVCTRCLGVSFLLGCVTVLWLLCQSIRKQRYWKKVGISYVKPYPFIGSFLDMLRKPAHDVELERYRKYGRMYGHYEGNLALLSVADPELLRLVLVKDFHAFTGRRKFESGDKITDSMLPMLQGEDWKRVRTIVTPTFTSGKIKKMMSILIDCSRTLVKNFKEASERGVPVEVKSNYGAFSMDIIASCAFSTKIDSHNDTNNKFVKAAGEVFKKTINWRIFMLALFPGVMKYFKISVFSRKALNFFSDVTLQIIEERKRTGQTRNDFLQLLIDSAKETAQEEKASPKDDDMMANYGKEEQHQIFKNYQSRKSLSQEELVAQCVIFFLAAHDTTASALSFASYLLALNPDVQEKLIQELDDTLKENEGDLTYEAVQGMKYLDNVISETLRLYPPSIRLERGADQDYKLGDTGVTIPKGSVVTVPVYAMHRDPSFFPDPEKFDPDRFTPEERAKRQQYVYNPFGAGPRNCVGMRFALLEVKVCLAHVLSNFRIKRCAETKEPLEFRVGQANLEPKNITLLMEVRKDTSKAL